MASLKFVPQHNICAFLNPSTPKSQKFAEIINFLLRSRICFAISVRPKVYRSHQVEFWSHAVYDRDDDPDHIRSTVMGQDVIISEEDIRKVLQFTDRAEDPVSFDPYLVKGCFLRMKYIDSVDKGNLMKKFLCPQFKYLMHVIMHCIGPRRGGFDSISGLLQSAMVALVLNKPYNFSRMIFLMMTENLKVDRKGEINPFLMYPRFIQLILDDKLPNLNKVNSDLLKFSHMTDETFLRMEVYIDQVPPTRRLFGHLVNVNYIAPEGKSWRHPDSDSDEEDLRLVSDSDSDSDDDNDHGADLGDSSQPRQSSGKAQVIDSDDESTDEEVRLARDTKIALKRSRQSSAGEPSGVRDRDRDTDPDYVHISSPAASTYHTQTDVSAPSSPARKKAKVVKKRIFKVPRKTKGQTSQPDIISPQLFDAIRGMFSGPSVISTGPTATSGSGAAATSISTPVILTMSPMQQGTAGVSFSTSTPVSQSQYDDLKKTVDMLVADKKKQDGEIAVLQMKVIRLEKENRELKKAVFKAEATDSSSDSDSGSNSDSDTVSDVPERRTKRKHDGGV